MRMKDVKEEMSLHGEHSSDIECSPCNDRGIKLTIFTYKWVKCVKPVGKWLIESLIQQGF